MYNDLITAISQNKETFKDCRIYLYELFGNDRDKVINLEKQNIEYVLPYYIKYIESKGVDMMEAMNHFAYEVPNTPYYSLLKITIVNVFRKIENKDLTFIPF